MNRQTTLRRLEKKKENTEASNSFICPRLNLCTPIRFSWLKLLQALTYQIWSRMLNIPHYVRLRQSMILHRFDDFRYTALFEIQDIVLERSSGARKNK